jgi:hypothetical protein
MHMFERPGESNTSRTLELARERADALGISTFVVATTSGRTGLEAARLLTGRRLVVVTHSTGFSKPGVQEADPALIGQVRGLGASVLTATHAFGGVGRSIRRRLRTYETEEIIAQSLRIFGQGTKVAVEIALMAADAGLLAVEEDVVSIGGTESGADTALVLRPAHAQDFFDVRVREIVCKPY